MNKCKIILFIVFCLLTSVVNAENYTPFKERLGFLESSNNYKAIEINKSGEFLGKYQFGKLALIDLKLTHLSRQEFLNNPTIQEQAITNWIQLLEKRLKVYKLNKYIGTTYKGVRVTKAGLLAASHLGGTKAVQRLFKSGYNPNDRFGTSLLDYMYKFQDIQI